MLMVINNDSVIGLFDAHKAAELVLKFISGPVTHHLTISYTELSARLCAFVVKVASGDYGCIIIDDLKVPSLDVQSYSPQNTSILLDEIRNHDGVENVYTRSVTFFLTIMSLPRAPKVAFLRP